MDHLSDVLEKIRATGEMPSEFKSQEETNTLGPSNVSEEKIAELRSSFQFSEEVKYIIVEGIMLFYDGSPLLSKHQLDLALFLRSRYADLKARREARDGYVTLEGFWKDPPGYFDDIVWPGYVKSHSHLFVDRKLEGPLTDTALTSYKLNIPPSLDMNMQDILEWSLDKIKSMN